MKKTLLLGCGNSRDKRMGVEGDHDWGQLVTADIDPGTGCDVVCDLNDDSLPFSDAEFDEMLDQSAELEARSLNGGQEPKRRAVPEANG